MNQSAAHKWLGGAKLNNTKPANLKALFEKRLATNFSLVQRLFFSLYPDKEDVFKRLLLRISDLFESRPIELKLQDLERLRAGDWYQDGKWVGMQLYVDRFSDNLNGLNERLPYLENLGVNLLHLMPLTERPAGPNDGGYAVNSYTAIDSRFGTEADLKALTSDMREKGMCLMLDFVVNHTSDEFPWAVKAKEGDAHFQNFYFSYPDRTIPDLFEQHLPEIFPETAPGNFTYISEMDKWVMTVFNRYQWDLNYSNPEVFLEMLSNLVALANLGVDVVRFDALAFLWKKIGTASQNLPEAHRLISLFRLCLQVVAPGVILLAEAIVAPREIIRYFGEAELTGNECELAYNATFMACLWDAIATKKTNLLYKSLLSIPPKPDTGSWINYIRCHDDIGLGFDDNHIRELGWDPGLHRRFLIDYYCQRLDWSPSAGSIFMYNPLTGDGRITGSAASLLGLEKALSAEDAVAISESVQKIVMLYGIVLGSEGIPLIYAGDEIGTLNDYSYLADPDKSDDSRWVNRPFQNWELVAGLGEDSGPEAQIFNRIKELITLRKRIPALGAAGRTLFHHSGNEHLFVFERRSNADGLMVIANFDAAIQVLNASWLEKMGYLKDGHFINLADGASHQINSGLLQIKPHDLLWILRN